LAGEKVAHFGGLCRGAQVRRRELNLVHCVEKFGWGESLQGGTLQFVTLDLPTPIN